MASKQPFKLFDVKMMGIRTWLKAKYFIKHTILMQKKSMLIIGDEKLNLYVQLKERLANNWQVEVVNDANFGSKNEEEIMQNYLKAQNSLNIQHYDAVVVLPQAQTNENKFNFQDEGFVTKFPTIYLNSIIRNIFAYKMASKYLQKTGVVILSCNQKEFYNLRPFDYEQFGRGRHKTELKSNPHDQYSISHCLSDGAIAYLGLILGQRYDVNLNSHSVIALSSEKVDIEAESLAKFYFDWTNRRNLPSPGSFAKFISPSEKVQSNFVEYL